MNKHKFMLVIVFTLFFIVVSTIIYNRQLSKELDIKNDDLNKYTQCVVQQGDFGLTLISARQYLSTGKNIVIAEFNYNGKHEVTIYTASSYHSFSIIDKNGKLVYSEEVLLDKRMIILERDYKKEFKLDLNELNLEVGEYTLTSSVRFELEGEYVSFNTNVPFKIV